MDLTRDQKIKRAEAKVAILERKLERLKAPLESEIKTLKEEIDWLVPYGYRVHYSEPLGTLGRYHDYTRVSFSSMKGASIAADRDIALAKSKGIKTTKVDLFRDSPKEEKDWDL